MQKLQLKHLTAIRWFHWINFPLLLLMVWSGLLIYWAYDIYHIGPLHLFPKWVYLMFGIDHMLAEGMALHFFIMWLFMVNGFLYVTYTVFSGEWRFLVPRSVTAFRDAWHVLLFDLGLRKALPAQEKYNAAQQLSYTATIVMGAGSLLTGLAIYKPAQLTPLVVMCGGYAEARLIHFVLTLGYLVFLLVHIIQVIRSGGNNLRSMLIGYTLVDERE